MVVITTHYSLLTTHYSLLTTHYSLLTTHYSLLTTHYSLLTTHYSLLTTHYSLLTTHYSLLTTHYSLLTTHYSLLTTHYSLLTTNYSLLTTHYSLLTTHYSLLTTHARCRRLGAPLNMQFKPAQAGHDDDKGDDLDDAERRNRAVAAALLPHGERDGSEHMGAGSDQKDRGTELAHREDEDVDPARHQDRRQQRQQDAPEYLAEPRARHLGDLLELAMHLRNPARREEHAVGQVQGHIGDQQDPDRVVDRDRQHQISHQNAGPHDHARDRDRDERDGIENPAEAGHRPQRHPGHDEGETGHDGG